MAPSAFKRKPESEYEEGCVRKESLVNHDGECILINQSPKSVIEIAEVENEIGEAKLSQCYLRTLEFGANNVKEK